MPIYEYRCTTCDNKMEVFHKVVSDYPPCPQCRDCKTEMIQTFSLSVPQIFQEYMTRNIRKDGSEVRVTSAKQENQLCRENGVVKADSGKM